MINNKNTIPTSFTIDLSTIDKKVDKLTRYLHNCSIDIKSDNLEFENPFLTYDTLYSDLNRREYKTKLATLVSKIYTERFVNTRKKLADSGVVTNIDLLIPQPIDDFGATFDAFAATNTDPDNLVLKVFNVKPYKFLKVDIHDEEEITTYVDNVASASYDLDNLRFFLNKLDSITNIYANQVGAGLPFSNYDLKSYVDELRREVFYLFNNINDVPQQTPTTEEGIGSGVADNAQQLVGGQNENIPYDPESADNILYNLFEMIPELNVAKSFIDRVYVTDILYPSGDTNLDNVNSRKLFPPDVIREQIVIDIRIEYGDQNVKQLLGDELYKTEVLDPADYKDKFYDVEQIRKARIKLIDFLIRKKIENALKEKSASLSFLSEFKSKYNSYNFLEQKLISDNEEETKIIPKEQLFFKLTFLRESEQVIDQKIQKSYSPLNVEFINKQTISLQSPFGSPDRNNKFVGIIAGTDLGQGTNSLNSIFFEPTVLLILSDIDYIDSVIIEKDPFYCPTPQSLQPDTKIERDKYIQNEVTVKNLERTGKYFLDSRKVLSATFNTFLQTTENSFNYLTFPDRYFMPNRYEYPIEFFRRIQSEITEERITQYLLDFSKYSYNSESETTVANVLRDRNANELLRKSLRNNGPFGLYEVKKTSTADPLSINTILNRINNLGIDAQSELYNIIFARTNFACLIKELQTCLLPNLGNCKDILKGFRFSELESIIDKAFPNTLYPQIHDIVKQWKLNNLEDEVEKRLLREIDEIEEQIENNERKRIIDRELDRRTEPGTALSIADTELGLSSEEEMSLQDLYEKKLQEYRELKLNQTLPLNEEERKRMQDEMSPEQLRKIDDFLNTLEEQGVDVSVLCDLVKLFGDILFNTSFPFGTIVLPELPTIDLFQETKLSIDLTIIQLILDAIVAFISKILEELLSCGGIKGLLQAGITGEASGSLTGVALAAVNQLATGRFDIDDFVDQNPAVDPSEWGKSLAGVVNGISNSVTLTQNAGLQSEIDLGVVGNIKVDAKSTTVRNLTNPQAPTVSQIQTVNSLKGLISGLAAFMQPAQFLNIVSGRANEAELMVAARYVQEQRPDLSGFGDPRNLSALFGYIGMKAGLDKVADELYSVSTTIREVQQRYPTCVTSPVSESEIPEDSSGQDLQQASQPTEIGPDDRYRQLIIDMLNGSPDTIKNQVSEQIFKPLLIGKLPNGNKVKNVEKAQKELVKNTFKNILKKFKDNCNEFCSSLTYKEKFLIDVPKKLKSGDNEYDNPEYKDLINKGGYIEGEEPENIRKEEYRYILGGMFRKYFPEAANNLSIESTPDNLTFTLFGKMGYPDINKENVDAALDNQNADNYWKIVSKTDQSGSVISFYTGNSTSQNTEVFSYNFNENNTEEGQQQSIDIQSIYRKNNDAREQFNNLLKDSIIDTLNIPNNRRNDFVLQFRDYSENMHAQFLSLIYRKITSAISNDGLLKPMNLDSLNAEVQITGIRNGLDSLFPFLSTFTQAQLDLSNFKVTNPNIDVPLKYINFCPRPTKIQKQRNIDPGLYGKLELEQFVYQMLEKRQTDLIDLETLETMLADKDNTIKMSLIDGMYLSMIRNACADYCLRTIFPLRVFKYDKKFIENMMLPILVSETLIKEFESYSLNEIGRRSFLDLSKEHIEYIHNFIFQNKIDLPENEKMFKEIKDLKKELVTLEEDKNILRNYVGRLNLQINIASNTQDRVFPTTGETVEQLQEYKILVNKYIDCLETETTNNKNRIFKLQIKNIAYNELLVMFDKLSYLTSTNESVREALGESCNQEEFSNPQNEKEFLKSLIPDLLINSKLYKVTSEAMRTSRFIARQEEKFVEGRNLIVEHYVYVPKMETYDDLLAEQNRLRCKGVVTFGAFEELLKALPNNDLTQYFRTQKIKYGMRVIYVPETNLVSAITHDPTKTITENFDKLISEGKNVFFVGGQYYTFKNAPDTVEPINRFNKTYAIPYLSPEIINPDGSRKRRFGVVNAFPIIQEEQDIPINKVDEMLDFINVLNKDIKNDSAASVMRDMLKAKILCNENLSNFYEILTNQDMLSNLLVLSSNGVLSNPVVKLPFSSLRFEILQNIYAKMCSIYSENDWADLLEKISSTEYFKQFNAALIAKKAVEAAVYVLQYYCQMTDPNISNAMLIRNAVKLALSAASQIPTPLPPGPPPQLPVPLTPLLPYSFFQFPVNVFGVPPVGIGIGPPITIPGIVLLAAEVILLSLEFFQNSDANIENEALKEELKKYCFDLTGYKKYGIE